MKEAVVYGGDDFIEVIHSVAGSPLNSKGKKAVEDATPELIGILGANGIDPEAAAKVIEQIVPIIQEVLRRNTMSYKIEQGVKEFKDLAIKTLKDAKDFAAKKIEGGIEICQDSFDKTVEWGSQLVNKIKEVMPVIREALEQAFEDMMNKTRSIFKATENFIDSTKEVFNKIYNDISESVTKFIKDVVSIVQTLSEEVSKHTEKAMKVGKEFLDNAKKTVEEISVNARIGVGAAGVVIEHGAKAAGQAMATAGSAAYEAGKAGLDKASEAAIHGASKAGEGVYQAKGVIMGKVSDIAQSIAVSTSKSATASKDRAEEIRNTRESSSGKGR